MSKVGLSVNIRPPPPCARCKITSNPPPPTFFQDKITTTPPFDIHFLGAELNEFALVSLHSPSDMLYFSHQGEALLPMSRIILKKKLSQYLLRKLTNPACVIYLHANALLGKPRTSFTAFVTDQASNCHVQKCLFCLFVISVKRHIRCDMFVLEFF